VESMGEYMEWIHSTWNPPGMWGQGKLLFEEDSRSSLDNNCFRYLRAMKLNLPRGDEMEMAEVTL